MNDYDAVKEDITEIKKTVEKIFKILNGNGGTGLVTRVALNKQSISRVWWWVGILSGTFVSGSIYFLFRSAA